MEASVFDIDGTLLESFEADCDLYVLAVRKVLGIASIDTDWSAYTHVTDQGVLLEIMRLNGIDPRPSLIEAVKHEFLRLLTSHVDANGAFREIPGARRFVSGLAASDGHFVAYATGAWRESALLKLTSAGFPVEGIPLASSSDFEDRVSIMRGAIAAAPSGLGRVRYFGDGVWDRAAAAELGWDFVPVGPALDGATQFDPPDAAAGDEVVVFVREQEVRHSIASRFAALKAELQSLVPHADIQHVGSTAVPGSLTKGDLDIQVRIDASLFADALERMQRRFAVNSGGFAEADAVSFDDVSRCPSVGIHLTVIDGAWDIQWKFRDRLIASSRHRAEYDQLKRRFHGGSMNAYRDAKAEFVARIQCDESAMTPGLDV